jgi:hypothetical protein
MQLRGSIRPAVLVLLLRACTQQRLPQAQRSAANCQTQAAAHSPMGHHRCYAYSCRCCCKPYLPVPDALHDGIRNSDRPGMLKGELLKTWPSPAADNSQKANRQKHEGD